MIKFRISITGTAPLLMHNSRLADPLDSAAKAVKKATGKRLKTEDDHLEIARLEHAGGLYHDAQIGPYLPDQNFHRCLSDGARKSRNGPRVKEGVFISTEASPVIYRGPRDVDGLWKDENFRHWASIKVNGSRVMRCRPIFREWSVECDGILDPNVLDMSDLDNFVQVASQLVGLGDWRPRFGRFTATLDTL